MAGELQGSFVPNDLCYFLLRDTNANIWNNPTNALVSYSAAGYSGYPITGTEQGGSSAYYVGSMPAGVPAGSYGVVMKQQISAFPAESDPTIDVGNIEWGGSFVVPLSSLATSGQLANLAPVRLARGTMIRNFEFYLVSSADHITPFTSGVISGQISRDGNAPTALQSGAFTEVGLGLYSLQALTSGDLLADTAGLVFTANGQSGGSSDPRVFTFVLQKVSGQV